jgi:hypothetical protein
MLDVKKSKQNKNEDKVETGQEGEHDREYISLTSFYAYMKLE